MADDPDHLYRAYGQTKNADADERKAERAEKRLEQRNPEDYTAEARLAKALRDIAALKSDLAEIKNLLGTLRGAGGIKVTLPIIAFTGQAGKGTGGTPHQIWVVDNGILQLESFLKPQ